MNWQYISGFFDADGYITLSRNKPNQSETPIVGLTNTKLDILEEIRDYILNETGVKGVICTKTTTKKNHTTSYDLRYVGFNKIAKLEIVSIHTKKKQRIALLKEIKMFTPRNGRYNEITLSKRAELVQRFLNIK